MRPHHKKAIENFTEIIRNDPKFIGLIIGGSIVKDYERNDSDIDVILIATDEEYQKRKKRNKFGYFNDRACDFEGGYIDGKIVNLDFLKTVAERGSEPAREAFKDAHIVYSKIPELEEILNKIPVYQKDEQSEKIKKFYSQFQVAYWYCKEAIKMNNMYLLTRAISDLILYGGRLILAYNEVLYPYHKWFMRVLSEVRDKPEDLMVKISNVLEKKDLESINIFYNAIRIFRKWDVKVNPFVQFMLDTELAWMDGKSYIGDL
jgi:predicted nucleotidyltransferase